MKNQATIVVKTWDGKEKPIHKAELRAELDQDENVFFKIEGTYEDEKYMVNFDYDRERATERYNGIVKNLMWEQERWLKQYVGN